MKKLFGFLSFVFSLVILFSCEPGRDENGDLLFGVNNPGENGGGTTGIVKHLKSVTSKDDSGKTVTFNYTYLSME